MPCADESWQAYVSQELARGRLAAQDFPFKLIETTGERALDTWRSLKAQTDGAPIVLGGPGDLYRIADRLAFMRQRGDTPDSAIAAADRIAFPDDLLRDRDAQHAESLVYWQAQRDAGRAFPFDPDEEWPPTGPWPLKAYEEEPLAVASQWDIERDASVSKPAKRIPLDEAYIAVLTGAEAAEAPAHVLWGDWNDVPRSEMLVAALRSWRERYGAELVGMSHDTWSLFVERPPQDRDEALALAREMVALCSDLLGEVKTLQGQAALAMANRWWNFWWD